MEGDDSSSLADDTASRGSRVKSILKKYYGTTTKAQDPSDMDTSNIDGANFDPQRYYNGILQEKSLPDLIVRNNDLVAEIKMLDNDMQMLVYENYNKFISATDTIRKMKTNVQAMEDEMGKLSSNVEEISRQSDAINENLSAHRVKIEQLNGVRKLLKKLQFLFELPARLHRAMKLEAYGQAVKYYASTNNVLKQYSYLASFKPIYEEAEQIAQLLREKLKAKMNLETTPFPDVCECVRLLLDLKESDESLRNAFLEGRKTRLAQKLEAVAAGEDSDSEHNSKSLGDGASDADKSKSRGMQGFLTEFIDTCSSYQTLFITPPARGHASTPTPGQDPNKDKEKEQQLSASAVEAKKQLTEWARTVFRHYFTMSSERLLEEDSPLSVAEVVHKLAVFYEDVISAHKVVPEAKLADSGAEVVERTIQTIVGRAFTTVQIRVIEIVQNIGSASSAGSPPTSDAVVPAGVSKIMGLIEDVLKKLAPFVSTENTVVLAGYVPLCVSTVHGHVRQLILSILDTALSSLDTIDVSLDGAAGGQSNATGSSPLPKPPTFALLLARLTSLLDESAIQQIQTLLASTFPVPSKFSSSPSMVTFKAAELKQESKRVSELLVARYVDLQARKLSHMFRKGLDSDWMKMKEPKDVRLVVGYVLEAIVAMDAEIIQVVGKDPSPAATGRDKGIYGGGRGSGPSVGRREIDRLFAQKIQLFAPVAFQHRALLTAIIRVAIKSEIEFIRLKTIGKNGFQQMQIDSYFLRQMLRPFVNDESVLDSLTDEVVNSAADRCTDPVPLDQSLLDAIVEEKRVHT